MTKQVIVGDMHGRDSWLGIVKKEIDFDRFIFIGDYVDSYDISGGDQLNNLEQIIDFKKRHKDKVILLVGNHDFQYIDNGLLDEKYSGFQSKMYQSFKQVFMDNIDLFQMCFEDEYGTVYSHAGLTKTFVESKVGSYSMEQINPLFKHKPSSFGFTIMDRSGYGESRYQSCIWVRLESLYNDQIDNLQVVGHTSVSKINHPPKSERRGFYLIDALPNQYLVREDEEFIIKTV